MKYNFVISSRMVLLISIVGAPVFVFAQDATDYTTTGQWIEVTGSPTDAMICPTIKLLFKLNSDELNIPGDPDNSGQPMSDNDRVFVAALNKTQQNEVDASCLDLPVGAKVMVVAQHVIDGFDQSLAGYKDWIGVGDPYSPNSLGDPVDEIMIPYETKVETHFYDPNASSENAAIIHPIYTATILRKNYYGWLDTYWLQSGP